MARETICIILFFAQWEFLFARNELFLTDFEQCISGINWINS